MNDLSPEEKTLRNIRRLIWLYFWLLLFEGALRKWVVPGLSNPLLIVRDPVVVAIFFLSLKARVFPWNWWVISLGIIGTLSMLVSYVQLWPYLRPERITLVAGFGFRSNFLHLPLIFVMWRVLRTEDVKRFGWWTLLLVMPMTALLVMQFNTSPDSFWNRTAGGEGEMMTAALGKVRTAGTFSFVLGVVAFYALATGYVIWGALRGDVYQKWLIAAAGAAVLLGVAVSGSRSVVGACAVVVGSLVAVLVLRPAAMGRLGQLLLAVLVIGFVLTRTPIFQEGANVLTTRFVEVAEATDTSVGAGLVQRVFADMAEGVFVWTKAPFLGYGLGIGTNAGAKFLTGRMTFLLSEGEWSRVFLESGPVLGLAFVLWRLALMGSAGVMCLRSVKVGNVLPLLLFSSSFMALANGQFGQPTVLGFAVFATGLALAARKFDDEEISSDSGGSPEPEPQRRVVGRLSPYAERLRGELPPPSPVHSNGSVDR
jgi:hypothetical protein